jgi:biopolymer transport protein ExbD
MSSHGAASSDKCEPNLIPLLDLVLQLVMFFMVCANFVMVQMNKTIALPEAIAAAPLGEKEQYVIFLNINEEGHVLLSPLDVIGDEHTLTNAAQVRTYMKRRYDEDMRAARPDEKDKGPRSLLVLRADKRTSFEKVYAIETACQSAGYPRIQVRTIRHGGSTK